MKKEETLSDIFNKKLLINKPDNLKSIVDNISKIGNLLDTNSDIKGDAFEYFLKNSISVGNDLGEYFTPRHIVKFMIKILNEVMKDRWLTNNKGEVMKYIDPTCGTGGFLINIFKQLRKEIMEDEKLMPIIKSKSVWGVELSKRTSEIAKMNMILAGDGHTNIINDNFLDFIENNKDITDNIPKQYD